MRLLQIGIILVLIIVHHLPECCSSQEEFWDNQWQRLYFLDIARHNKFIWDEGKSHKFPCSGLTVQCTQCNLPCTMCPIHHHCNGDKTPRNEVHQRVTLHPLVTNCMGGGGGIECPLSFIILLPEVVLSRVWEPGIMTVSCSQVCSGKRLGHTFWLRIEYC